VDDRDERCDNPQRLHLWTCTEKIDLQVDDMARERAGETERQRRQPRVAELPAFPPLTNRRGKKPDEANQPADPAFRPYQQELVVNGKNPVAPVAVDGSIPLHHRAVIVRTNAKQWVIP